MDKHLDSQALKADRWIDGSMGAGEYYRQPPIASKNICHQEGTNQSGSTEDFFILMK